MDCWKPPLRTEPCAVVITWKGDSDMEYIVLGWTDLIGTIVISGIVGAMLVYGVMTRHLLR